MDDEEPFVRQQDKGTLGHESEVTANDDENNQKRELKNIETGESLVHTNKTITMLNCQHG